MRPAEGHTDCMSQGQARIGAPSLLFTLLGPLWVAGRTLQIRSVWLERGPELAGSGALDSASPSFQCHHAGCLVEHFMKV